MKGYQSSVFQSRRALLGYILTCSPPTHCQLALQVRTNRTASGWAVVKTWCVPVLKVKQRGYAPCSPKKAYTQVKLLLAQEQVSENIELWHFVKQC